MVLFVTIMIKILILILFKFGIIIIIPLLRRQGIAQYLKHSTALRLLLHNLALHSSRWTDGLAKYLIFNVYLSTLRNDFTC